MTTSDTAVWRASKSPTLLRVQGVWKAFEGVPVLRGIDLKVARHEAVVLIGASGSGKSTLLRCINGLEQVDAGSILLDGSLDVTDLDADLDQVRRRIGIVFQSYNLFPHMRVVDNVTLAPRKVLGRSREQAESEAMTLLDRLGSRTRRGSIPIGSPGASPSGRLSPEPWPWIRRSCCSTRSPPPWIHCWSARSSMPCANCEVAG